MWYDSVLFCLKFCFILSISLSLSSISLSIAKCVYWLYVISCEYHTNYQIPSKIFHHVSLFVWWYFNFINWKKKYQQSFRIIKLCRACHADCSYLSIGNSSLKCLSKLNKLNSNNDINQAKTEKQNNYEYEWS